MTEKEARDEDVRRLLTGPVVEPTTILEVTDAPRVKCSKCGSELLGRGWLEHFDDGSHAFYPADAHHSEWACPNCGRRLPEGRI